jgi:excisionase family DNA binding protein
MVCNQCHALGAFSKRVDTAFVTEVNARSEMTVQPELLTTREAAKFLGITPGTLAVWRCETRYSIPYVSVGSRIRYRPEDLNKFLESRRVDPAKGKPKRKRTRKGAA